MQDNRGPSDDTGERTFFDVGTMGDEYELFSVCETDSEQEQRYEFEIFVAVAPTEIRAGGTDAFFTVPADALRIA